MNTKNLGEIARSVGTAAWQATGIPLADRVIDRSMHLTSTTRIGARALAAFVAFHFAPMATACVEQNYVELGREENVLAEQYNDVGTERQLAFTLGASDMILLGFKVGLAASGHADMGLALHAAHAFFAEPLRRAIAERWNIARGDAATERARVATDLREQSLFV